MVFDPTHLSTDAPRAAELGAAHVGSTERIQKAISEFEAELRDSLVKDIPPAAHRQVLDAADEMIRTRTAEQREKLLAKEASAFKDRTERLERMAADAAAFKRIAPSPRALLETKVHADPARFAALSAMLMGAKPATLSTHLALFLQDPSDHILAASLSRALDALDPKLRPVSSKDVSDAAVGETWRSLTAAASSIEYAHQRAKLHETSLRTGKPAPAYEKVQLGLLGRAAGVVPTPREPQAGPRTALDRIVAGLAARREAK